MLSPPPDRLDSPPLVSTGGGWRLTYDQHRLREAGLICMESTTTDNNVRSSPSRILVPPIFQNE